MASLAPRYNWTLRAFAGELAGANGITLHKGLHAAVFDAMGRPVAVCGPLEDGESVEHAAAISATFDLLAAAELAIQVLQVDQGKQARLRAIDRLQAAINKARTQPGTPPKVAQQEPAPYSPAAGAAIQLDEPAKEPSGAMTTLQLWQCLTEADARRADRGLPLEVRVRSFETYSLCLRLARERGMDYSTLRAAANRARGLAQLEASNA